MAIPTFVGAGTGTIATGPGAVAATLDGVTVAIGDIVIYHVLTDGVQTPVLGTVANAENLAGTDSTLTSIGTFAVGSAEAARQSLWIGRALVTDGSTISCGNTEAGGNDRYQRVYAFTSVNTGTTLADVIENGTAGTATNGAGTSITVADTSVTTLGSDRLACNFIAINDDNALVSFTGETGGDWTVTADYGSATGTDGEIGLQTAEMASAGTIDGGTYTQASDAWGVVGFALIGIAAAPPTLVASQPGIDFGSTAVL